MSQCGFWFLHLDSILMTRLNKQIEVSLLQLSAWYLYFIFVGVGCEMLLADVICDLLMMTLSAILSVIPSPDWLDLTGFRWLKELVLFYTPSRDEDHKASYGQYWYVYHNHGQIAH